MARRLKVAFAHTFVWLVCVLLLPAVAAAKNGFDANRFVAPPLATDGLTLARPTTLASGTFAGALTFSYANDPLVVETETGPHREERLAVISDQLWAYLSGGYGLTENITLHAVIPISIDQQGTTEGTDLNAKLHSAAMGDLGIGARLRLFGGLPTSSFGLALDGVLVIPTGSREAFSSDGAIRVRGTILAEAIPLTSLYVTANVGAMSRPTIEAIGATTANMLLVTVAGGVRTDRDGLRLGLEATMQTPFGDEKGTGFETLVVGALAISGVHASVGIGPGFGDGPGTPDFRAVARLGWAMGATK